MKDTAAEIRENAAVLRELHSRIDETDKLRSRSRADQDAWRRACAEFHARYSSLSYPGGDGRWQALMLLDSAELETGIAFIETDPYFFRSGYMKEAIWRRFKAAVLSPKQLHRLEVAAMSQLRRQIRRDFWYMVRFVRMRATLRFWEEVGAIALEGSGAPSLKAWWLLLARANHPVQYWIRCELMRARYEKGHVPDLSFGWRAA